MSISIPLAAISVATRTLTFPCLNSFSARCLWFCDLSPCMAALLMSFFLRFRTIRSEPCFVRENTSTCSILGSLSICSSNAGLFDLFVLYKNCCIVSAVEETGLTAIFWGFLKICRDNSTMFFGIVAEKKRDCLCLGSFAIIFLISWIKPISNIRSASSSTKYSISLSEINP